MPFGCQRIMTNYAGEFVSNLDRAEMHVRATMNIVVKSLLEA